MEKANMSKAGYQCTNVAATNQMYNCSRHELLRWINDTLNLKVKKVESLCSGAVYCSLLNLLFPGCVPVKRLKYEANQQHEFITNLKILQNAFTSIGCNKEVPIDRLIQSRYQDNFEFLQWFKRFFDANNELECDADIQIQENKASNLLLKKNKKPTPAAYVRPPSVECQPTSRNKLTVLELQRDDKKDQIDALTKERDFYFQKLRHLEVICLEHSDAESGPQSQIGALASQILAKLYETEEGFCAPEETEEESY